MRDGAARRIGPARAAALAVAVLAVLGTAAQPASGARDKPREKASTSKLSEEFLQHRFTTWPQDASRLGIRTHDNRLVPMTESLIENEIQWNLEFQDRVKDGLQRSSRGSSASRVELNLLRTLAERQRFELQVVGIYQKNPASYLPMLEGSIRSLLDRRLGSVCNRIRSISQRLQYVPEVLRAAQINLREPSRVAVEAAIPRYEAVLALYRNELPSRAQSCRDASNNASLAQADTQAVRSTQQFLEWMREDLVPLAKGPQGVGGPALSRWYQKIEFEPISLEIMEERANAEVAMCRKRIATYSAQLAIGADSSSALALILKRVEADTALNVLAGKTERDSGTTEDPALDRIKALTAQATGGDSAAAMERVLGPPVPESERAEIVNETVARAWTFLKKKKLVELPKERPVARTASSPSGALVELDAPGVWHKGKNEVYLNVSTAATRTSREELMLGALREGVPGRDLMEQTRRRVKSKLRAAYPSPSSMDGWSAYAVDVMLEQGFEDHNPRLHLLVEQARLLRLARLIAEIRIHRAGDSVETVASMIQTRCGLSPDQAMTLARRAAVDPVAGAGLVAEWRLAELRQLVQQQKRGRFKLAEFHKAVLAEGPVSPSVARPAILRRLGIDEEETAGIP